MTTNKRAQAESPRERFLYTSVTKDEFKEISKYCREQHISISQFFAELLIEDASKSKGKGHQKMTLEIELTPEEYEKLELLARLHKKESIEDYVLEVLKPELRIQRLHTPTKTKHVRYYFSDDEHQMVTRHMKQLGKSSSNYPAALALRVVRKAAKKQGK